MLVLHHVHRGATHVNSGHVLSAQSEASGQCTRTNRGTAAPHQVHTGVASSHPLIPLLVLKAGQLVIKAFWASRWFTAGACERRRRA